MEVSVFSVLVCLFTFLFLVSEVLGNTELAKEVTGIALLLCKYILIHDWCGNSVLYLHWESRADDHSWKCPPIPGTQCIHRKDRFNFQFKTSSLLCNCFYSLDIVLNSNIYQQLTILEVISGLAMSGLSHHGLAIVLSEELFCLSKKKELLCQIFWFFNGSNKGNGAPHTCLEVEFLDITYVSPL